MFKPYQELLTIGIPAYNESKYIKQTIESCINQAALVIIADNASTDNTRQICEELSKIYPNLIYIRHKENIGGTENFNYLLRAAKTKYFMWMGGHDYIDPGYTTHMIHLLENTDSAGCYPASRAITKDDQEIGIYDCWYQERLASDSGIERVYTLIAHLHECSALFGIYHTKLMQEIALQPIIGNDHVFICRMASKGRLIYSPRSIYNWRQTKYGTSAKEEINLWTASLGNKNIKISASRKEMKDEQLQTLKKAGYKGISGYFKKLKLIRKARKKLNNRFGD